MPKLSLKCAGEIVHFVCIKTAWRFQIWLATFELYLEIVIVEGADL